MLWILTAVFVAGLGLCLGLGPGKKGEKPYIRPICMGLAALLSVLTAVTALTAGGVLNAPGNPRETAETFFFALQTGNYQTADDCLAGGDGLGVTEAPDTADRPVYNTLLAGYGCRVVGEPVVKGTHGVLPVELTHFSLEAFYEDLGPAMTEALQRIVDDNPKREVFGEDGGYLPYVLPQAYEDGVSELLSHGSDYLVTDTVEVQLVWTFGGWKLMMDDSLLSALAGFTVTDGVEPILTGRFAEYTAQVSRRLQETAPLLDKHYTLDRNATVGQPADSACYGVTSDPYEVQTVVERAADLLDGQTLSWNPELNFRPGGKIRYYLDDTILVIVWQEIRNFAVVTFAEVKLADSTQIIRRLSNDTLGDFSWQYPTTMAKQSNAVVAISADFYMTRVVGVSVYQGQVFRNEPVSLDHCFVDYDGNLVLVKNKELSKSEIPQFVEDNNINFGVDFGPVLIRDGEKQTVTMYGIGEINEIYARSSIGQVGDLHYILMTINGDSMYGNAGTIRDSINYMYEKNCIHAYALDGGKTATIVFGGELANRPKQRTLSDMICFVSAVPPEDR